MKCDPTAVTVVTAAFIPLAGGLLCIRRRALRFFAVLLAAFAVLDLGMMWSGIGEALWWLIHSPSTIALGMDEILERHGAVVSTIAHTADLVFWSALLTVPIIVRTRQTRKRGRDSQP